MSNSKSKEVSIDDVILQGILSFVNYGYDSKILWTGTMTDLMSDLKWALNNDQRRVLPRSPSALRLVVNRVVNRIRNRGIGVRFGRTTDHARTRFVTFTQ